MPKTFKMLVEAEEVALGHVMNTLHRTPGVVKVDLLLGDTPTAKRAAGSMNGHELKKPRKPRYEGETSGADRLIQLLKKGPSNTTALKKAFEKDGRSPDSVSSLIYAAKNDGILQTGEDGYTLTKKGRDRARYV